jgi:hypothetical protein
VLNPPELFEASGPFVRGGWVAATTFDNWLCALAQMLVKPTSPDKVSDRHASNQLPEDKARLIRENITY